MPEPKALGILPVRRDSGRLPGKALLAETGRPLFLHTASRAAEARLLHEIWIATDEEEIREAAVAAGFKAVLTSKEARSGSERCARALRAAPGGAAFEIVLDIQGDWPEIDPLDLDLLVRRLAAEPGVRVATLQAPLDREEDFRNPHVVKVVGRSGGRALYFSRAPIPGDKEGGDSRAWTSAKRHIGVYAFRREALEELLSLPPCPLEDLEGLEQLRWLDAGWEILVVEASGSPRGIETRADYDAFVDRSRGRDPL